MLKMWYPVEKEEPYPKTRTCRKSETLFFLHFLKFHLKGVFIWTHLAGSTHFMFHPDKKTNTIT